MSWKKVGLDQLQQAKDCFILELEELDPKQPEPKQVGNIKDVETIDFSSFMHIDDFNESIPKEPKKIKKTIENQSNFNMSNWEAWGLHELVLKGLFDLGYEKPTEIQSNTLNHSVLYKKDVIGAAQTGSGKTLAFGLPILNAIAIERSSYVFDGSVDGSDEENWEDVESDAEVSGEEDDGSDVAEELDSDKESEAEAKGNAEEPVKKDTTEETEKSQKHITALILVPTRELALQVTSHLKAASKHVEAYIMTIVGGMSAQKQERLISKTPDIVVATPGRLWHLMNEHADFNQKLGKIKYLVLDEADRMLEQGHFKDLEEITSAISLERLPEAERKSFKRQTFIFSATMIKNLHSKYKHKKQSKKKTADDPNALFDALLEKIEFRDQPVYVNLTKERVTASGVLESKIECASKPEKDLMLYYLLTRYTGKSIVFVNSIDAIRRLVPIFSKVKEGIVGLHAEMQQKQRLKNLDRFTKSTDGVLISSDVAARGLDIPHVDHVIHYQIPRTTDTYVHRSGRTARGDSEGVSVMLVSAEDHTAYKKLCHSLGKPDGVPDFPVERTIADKLKPRLTIAKQIDELEHKNKKEKNDKDWFKKAAEDADIYLSDAEDEEQTNAEWKEGQRLLKLKAQMQELLSQSVLPKGQSAKYVTMNSHIASLAATQTVLPTVVATKATDDLKSFVKKVDANPKKRKQVQQHPKRKKK